jgi:uncharacterized protein
VNEGADGTMVTDVPEQGRLVVNQAGHTAELVYRVEPGRLVLVHTGVPPELEGRGIGVALVRASIARAAAQGLTVVPWCPFARKWLRAHPDAARGVAVDWTPP